MSASEALNAARAAGIDIVLDGGDLLLEAPAPPPTALLDALSRHKADIVALLRPASDMWLAEDWQVFYDERAGIAEFDGKQTRTEAEALAFECCIVEWLNRHHRDSDPGRCAWCGKLDPDGLGVVSLGTERHCHTWLHHTCWKEWDHDRREKACRALEAIRSFVSSGSYIPPEANLADEEKAEEGQILTRTHR